MSSGSLRSSSRTGSHHDLFEPEVEIVRHVDTHVVDLEPCHVPNPGFENDWSSLWIGAGCTEVERVQVPGVAYPSNPDIVLGPMELGLAKDVSFDGVHWLGELVCL